MRKHNALQKRDVVGRAIVAFRRWCKRSGVAEPPIGTWCASYILRERRIRIMTEKNWNVLAEYKIGRSYKLKRVK